MITLLQRVSQAQVAVEREIIGRIETGVLVFVGIEQGDDEDKARRLVERILDYRIFADGQGRMNRSLREVAGGLLLVPQFTLAADTASGTRPSFSPAARPEAGRQIFSAMLAYAEQVHPQVASGQFGARMDVQLSNNGPVTFILRM